MASHNSKIMYVILLRRRARSGGRTLCQFSKNNWTTQLEQRMNFQSFPHLVFGLALFIVFIFRIIIFFIVFLPVAWFALVIIRNYRGAVILSTLFAYLLAKSFIIFWSKIFFVWSNFLLLPCRAMQIRARSMKIGLLMMTTLRAQLLGRLFSSRHQQARTLMSNLTG